MTSVTPLEALALGPDELGESIGWQAETGELWRVDILNGLVHRVQDPLDDNPVAVTTQFQGEVGFALPRTDGGMVVGAERTLWLIDADGSFRALLELDERTENRWNDAICDAFGRLWAGTFARDRRTGAANLYRIDPDGSLEAVLGGLTNSNGMGWLDEGSRLHFVDSPTQRVDIFDVELSRGRLRGPRPLAEIPAEHGAPDGLCLDDQQGTWVALFGGGRVHRYDLAGNLDFELTVPVPHVTNVCLGGCSGTDLFATTTRHKLSATERARLPDAGRVFHARADVAGYRLNLFGG